LSDTPQAAAPYECVRVEDREQLGARLLSRRLKILVNHPSLDHPDAVLWHDAAFRMDYDPVRLVEEWLTADVHVLAFKHPHRTQIEEEAVAIAKWGWVPLETLQAQVATYRAEGFRQTMITSTGLCLRRLTPQVRAFNALWWAEVRRWGWRDQMSVDYAIWKAGLTLRYIPGHYRDNSYCKWHTW
jgi:hypothetical protein